MKALTEKLASGAHLDPGEVHEAAGMLLREDGSSDDKVAFLRALHEKGETAEEIAAFVEAFLEHARRPILGEETLPGPTIDVCGTGGDKLNLFNVSTTCIFILAAGGLSVVKHGNRGITSKSGGADVLEALGIAIDLEPEAFADCVQATGLGFLFAPIYHPAFKAVAPVRKILAEQGQKTIFNILGPLLNPVRPDFQLVGVFDPSLPPVYARILQQLGRREAWTVHGLTAEGRGVDELSTMGPTRIVRGRMGEGEPESWTVEPEEFGLPIASVEDLRGGDAGQNAAILRAILSGEPGPRRDLVLLNAGAAFVVAGLAGSLEEGIQKAAELIDRGAAASKLQALQSWCASRA